MSGTYATAASYPDAPDAPAPSRADYLRVDMSYHERLAHRFWRDVFFTGTELDSYETIFQKPWLFPHLGEDLDKEGALYRDAAAGKTVYLFGTTEVKSVNGAVVLVPIIFAVSTTLPLPDSVGIKSVQMEAQQKELLDDLRMGFRTEVIGTTQAQVQSRTRREVSVKYLVLHRRMGSALIETLSPELMARYQYANLYVFRPEHAQADLKEVTEPTIFTVAVTLGQRTVNVGYDAGDDITASAQRIITNHFKGISSGSASDVERVVLQIEEAKTAELTRYKQWRAETQRSLDECTDEYRQALADMKVIKYYPYVDNEVLEYRTNKLVNRFYGEASEVKGGSSPYETKEEFAARIKTMQEREAKREARAREVERKRLERLEKARQERINNPPKRRLTRSERIRLLEAELEPLQKEKTSRKRRAPATKPMKRTRH